MTDEDNDHDNIVRLFEQLKIHKTKKKRKHPHTALYRKLTINQWILIVLLLINLAVLALHIYNAMHVQEIHEWHQLNNNRSKENINP